MKGGGLTGKVVHQDKDDYEISLQCDKKAYSRKDWVVSAFASFLVVKRLSRGLLDHDPVISEIRSRLVERSTYMIAGYTHEHALI